MRIFIHLSCLYVALLWGGVSIAEEWTVTKDTGYRGIWYANQKTDTEYVYKYSGGLGTYCAKHSPFAIYAPEVEKTFFVYGGTRDGEHALLEMVSYYDHRTGKVPRPTVLIDKGTDDAHDNPVISVDNKGYIWVFASSHGTTRPSYIFRSLKPYDIDAFECVRKTNFSYPQPWWLPGQGFLFLHTYYKGGRTLNWIRSADGQDWTKRQLLAHIEDGHYQVSWPDADGVGSPVRKLGTAFNYHPLAFGGDKKRRGLNWRTNLYYAETPDGGETWRTASGTSILPPITTSQHPSLVRDYEAEGLLCYMKDLKYDAQGRPIILHLTSKSWEPGPDFGPRTWRIAHWLGDSWIIHDITTSDNNYDTGALFVEADGTWRVIGPTEKGPQAFNPGGEIAVWLSKDQGKTWRKEHDLTKNSDFNHTYVRSPLFAHPGFCAFWADGHGRKPSISRLYFFDREHNEVQQLPYTMQQDMQAVKTLTFPLQIK